MTGKDPILIVDDDTNLLESNTQLLRAVGYSVDTARTCGEALDKLAERYYILLLIDMILPDLDGIQLIKRIDDTDPKMRKVILTGYPSIENAIQSLNIGVDAYLIKPVDPENLLKTIADQLEKHDAEMRDRYPIVRSRS